jgi:short-chain fatty acids transporter
LLALSWGDQWTNLFQPFWALPLLGITGTRAGDILGYTMLLGVVTGVVFGLGAAIG